MVALKVLIAFSILFSAKYIVRVKKNPFYNVKNDFLSSSTNFTNSKMINE